MKQILFFLLSLLIFSRSSNAFKMSCDLTVSITYTMDGEFSVPMQTFTMANLCKKGEIVPECKSRWMLNLFESSQKNYTQILKKALKNPRLLSEGIISRIDGSSNFSEVIEFLFSDEPMIFQIQEKVIENYSVKNQNLKTLHSVISRGYFDTSDLYPCREWKMGGHWLKKRTRKITAAIADSSTEFAGIPDKKSLFFFDFGSPNLWYFPKHKSIRFYPLVAWTEERSYFVLTGILSDGDVYYSSQKEFLDFQINTRTQGPSQPGLSQSEIKIAMKCRDLRAHPKKVISK